jgi:signal transduction histidine kinase
MAPLRRTEARISPSLRSPFALLALARAGSVAVIGLLLSFQLRRVGEREASRATTREARLAGNAVVAPALDPGILGRILYSGEPRLIGRRHPLDPDDRAAFETGGSQTDVSDLSRLENRFERGEGSVVESHLPIEGPNGEPLLFELDQHAAGLTADGRRLLERMPPSLRGGLLLLQLADFARARRAADRLRHVDRQRAALLRRAVDASDFERRRLAADLHDGVVHEALLHRAAQEGLRNAAAHACALQDLPDDADGRLTISSSPGHGTVLRALVPTA